MSEVDWIIAAIIVVSAIVSFIRGFFKEAISLITWVAAVGVTLLFTARAAAMWPESTLESPTARYVISALVLFFGTMLIGGLINWLLRRLIGSSTLGFTDRLMGILFGVGRGALIVAVLVLLAHLMPTVKREVWWNESRLLPHFQNAARAIHEHLPVDIASYFDFSPVGVQ